MKRAVSLTAALAAALLPAGVAPGAPGMSRSAIESAVFLVRCGVGNGTAFRLRDGRLVTAAHVAVVPGCTINGVPVRPGRTDGALDIALLEGGPPPAGEGLEISCRRFRTGRTARAVGYIGPQPVSIPLIADREHDRDGFREFVGVVEPGMSGGPALDESGRAGGVMTQRWPARAREFADTFLCERSRT